MQRWRGEAALNLCFLFSTLQNYTGFVAKSSLGLSRNWIAWKKKHAVFILGCLPFFFYEKFHIKSLRNCLSKMYLCYIVKRFYVFGNKIFCSNPGKALGFFDVSSFPFFFISISCRTLVDF